MHGSCSLVASLVLLLLLHPQVACDTAVARPSTEIVEDGQVMVLETEDEDDPLQDHNDTYQGVPANRSITLNHTDCGADPRVYEAYTLFTDYLEVYDAFCLDMPEWSCMHAPGAQECKGTRTPHHTPQQLTSNFSHTQHKMA